MEELDLVVLNKDFEGLKAGVEGVIVLKYDETHFEVEFFTDEDETIGVYTMSAEYLRYIGPNHPRRSS